MTTTHQPPQFSGDLRVSIIPCWEDERTLRRLKRIKEENRKERYKYVVRYILHGHSAAQVGSHPLVRGDR